jgi:hypothetical protein
MHAGSMAGLPRLPIQKLEGDRIMDTFATEQTKHDDTRIAILWS